jgi:hypothetical protein
MECWDPLTGNGLPVQVKPAPDAASVELDLEPYGSRVLVFSRDARPGTAPPGGEALEAIDLSTGWEVRFGNAGAAVRMDQLRSWTDAEDTRYFSGVATYEKSFTVPPPYLGPKVEASVSFGEATQAEALPSSRQPRLAAMLEAPVREAAVVELNGKRVGSVWCPPYRLDISGFLVPGENRIRVTVGNLAINHMAGRPAPDYRLLNLRYGVRFEPQDMEALRPLPSGLLGPVVITGEKN